MIRYGRLRVILPRRIGGREQPSRVVVEANASASIPTRRTRSCSPRLYGRRLAAPVRRRLVPGHGVPEIRTRVAAAFHDGHSRVQVEAAGPRHGGRDAQQPQQCRDRRHGPAARLCGRENRVNDVRDERPSDERNVRATTRSLHGRRDLLERNGMRVRTTRNNTRDERRLICRSFFNSSL